MQPLSCGERKLQIKSCQSRQRHTHHPLLNQSRTNALQTPRNWYILILTGQVLPSETRTRLLSEMIVDKLKPAKPENEKKGNHEGLIKFMERIYL